jgi:hypothetical protein
MTADDVAIAGLRAAIDRPYKGAAWRRREEQEFS